VRFRKFDLVMKSYTDIEQSRKLAEILPLESADMYYTAGLNVNGKHYYKTPYIMECKEDLNEYTLPCWSIASLLSALKIYTTPTAFSTNMSVPSLTKTKNGYSITYVGDYRIMESNNNDIESPIEIVADNPVDACVAMIERLHELKLL
jgi:hypothetical protein